MTWMLTLLHLGLNHPLHARARDLLLIFLIDQKRYNEVTWLDHGPFFFILFPHLSHCGF